MEGNGVELIPGTALPIITPEMARQPEGRGAIQLREERRPPSLIEEIEDPDYLEAGERLHAEAAIRALGRMPRAERTVFQQAAGQTDATTGDLVLELYECPQGKEAHVTLVTVDTPNSTTITPAAPLANAAIWSALASLGPSSGIANSVGQAAALRAGLVAFSPATAAGPVLPGQWTWNDDSGPVVWGGQMLYYVLKGGSIAAALNLLVECTYRINLWSRP